MAITAAIMVHSNSGMLVSFQKLFRRTLLSRQLQYEALQDDNNKNGPEEADEHEQEQQREEELQLFHNLRTLGWIRRDGLLQQPLGEALHQNILRWVHKTIAQEFEEENLYDRVQDYKSAVVVQWLEDLVGPPALEADNWSARLDFCTAECYCLVRMEEIFDLVAEYPESHAAVLELRSVLERTKMHHALGEALKTSLVRRLNHPGANTSQIIDVYINTIKVREPLHYYQPVTLSQILEESSR
jgi:anaphase-promoting complex subunit 2